MAVEVQLYDTAYSSFGLGARERVRLETYGEDIGQNGWLTVSEWHAALGRLERGPGSSVLDVACGSGGPDLYLARMTAARVVGVDVNPHAIGMARNLARRDGLTALASFVQADARRALPFDDGSFDAIVCIDAINHLPDRRRVVGDWHRLLRPGGRLLFSDPAAGVAEMRRVVRPRGVIAACSWDFARGMTMLRTFWDSALAVDPGGAAEADATTRRPLCNPEELGELWRRVGLLKVDVGELIVGADHSGFDDFWWPFAAGAGSSGSYCASLDDALRRALREEVRRRLGSPQGPFRLTARAWYVRGVTPTDDKEG